MATPNAFDNAIVIIEDVQNIFFRSNGSQCKLFLPQVRTASNLTLLSLTGTLVPDNFKAERVILPIGA